MCGTGGSPVGSCIHEHRRSRYMHQRSVLLFLGEEHSAFADVGRVRPTLAEYRKTTGGPPVPHPFTLPSTLSTGARVLSAIVYRALAFTNVCGISSISPSLIVTFFASIVIVAGCNPSRRAVSVIVPGVVVERMATRLMPHSVLR